MGALAIHDQHSCLAVEALQFWKRIQWFKTSVRAAEHAASTIRPVVLQLKITVAGLRGSQNAWRTHEANTICLKKSGFPIIFNNHFMF